MGNEKKLRPFGWKDKVGYMLGNIGNDFTFIFASLFLTVFYTDVLGINAGLVGTMFLVSRIIDAFTDTAMGRIADKTKATKNGKFKPWLLRACGPVALASFLMYQTFLMDASMTVRVIYMFVTYLFWGSICYTAINIPYGSMASVMSAEADDRASLSTFRGVGSLIPQVVVGVVMPGFLYKTLEDGTKIANAEMFPKIALVMSILAAACYIACYFMCTERVKVTESAQSISFKDTLKALVSNKALIGLAIVYICFLGAQMLNQTINNYIFKDYFANTMGLTVMNAAGIAPALILAPLAVPLARKFGKKELGIFAAVSGAVAFFLLFILRTSNMWLYVVINIVGLLGFGLFNLIIWAFVSDVIDDQEVRTHVREDGTIYAVCSFARKLGQAIASALGGWSLAWIGYVEGSVVGQSPDVLNGIYNIATLVPAILYLIVGLSLVFIYPLSKKKVAENTAELKMRKGEI
ncbi:MAG: glycoside-pentoside-hexuronide (GPH):cation symporter [Lachnospiraceae bacterium]|nr:glycoside-pentoside-hexuronide (GPH):cation symporter [Lachnospiraceae bacterium]